MNETSWMSALEETWVGSLVSYNGFNRPDLKTDSHGRQRLFKVVQENDLAVGFEVADNHGVTVVQWCAKTAMRKRSNPIAEQAKTEKLEDMVFFNTDNPRDRLTAEIVRVEIRLAELKNALQVIDSI